jgi:hypothetical protein
MARDIITKARLEGGEIRTKANIGNTVYGTEVHSVNGKTGHVVLDAGDVGALPSDTPIPSLDGYATEEWVGEQGYLTEHQDVSGKADKATTLAGYGIENAYTKTEVDALVDGQTAPVSSVNGKTGAVTITAQELGALTEHQDISGKADKSEIPTKTSELTNDSGFLTQHQDLTPYALKSEIPVVPANVSAFTNDVGYLTQHQSLADYALKSEIPTVTNDFTNAYKNKVDSLWEDYQDALVALG